MPSAAILNGGRSERFGGLDKGALVVGGRSIRARQIAALTSVSDDVWIVGGSEPLVLDPRVRWAPDAQPGQGPLAGIEVALRVARHPLVVIVACDMPGITPGFLARLVALASIPGLDGPPDLVVPRTDRGYHPLCAVYRASTCLPIVGAHLAEGRLAVRELLGALRAREVAGVELAAAGDPGAQLVNVNTPAEHDALATLLAHDT